MLLGVAISNFWIVILGPPVLFLGVLIGGPVVAAGFTWVIGAIVRPLGSTTVRLGVENTRRNPTRRRRPPTRSSSGSSSWCW